ncbi:MAG: ABC transporter permease [Ignavibacteria bacterium]|nr:ABC transporter permease [Ignavibacteria bacterium]
MTNNTKIKEKLFRIWQFYDFQKRFFIEFFRLPFEFNETLKQFFLIGYKSLPLVSITGFIIGLTLALQLKPTLRTFGAESLIPAMLAISIVREIGPVIISLICAGKIGSGIGAELGSMRVTEQIAAMEISATNPFKYLVVTRVTASTLMIPVLVIYSNTISMLGGFIAVNFTDEVSIKLYMNSVFHALSFIDLLPATIKTFFFGYAIGIIGTYKGYNCSRGTESVGVAANTAVVLASLWIIIIDLIVVQITSFI